MEVGATTISVPSTYPAFHLSSGRKNSASATEEEEQRFMRNSEFAHVHTRYRGTSDPSGMNRPWQVWQGGGQGSLHVVLHPQDAQLLIHKGWAELHLLAKQGVAGIPSGLCLVYAPRDEAEMDIVSSIWQASLAWARGGNE